MSGTVGRRGVLRIGLRGGRKTTISEQFAQAPSHIQRAIYCDRLLPEMAYLYIMSSSGGILGGDRHALQATVGEGARAHMTTQGATRIYDTGEGDASYTARIVLEPNSYLEFLPDVAIPYGNSRYAQRVEVRCAPSATMTYTETLASGRIASGESFRYALYDGAVAAYDDSGAPRLYDRMRIEPARRDPRRFGMMGGHTMLGTAYVLAPAPAVRRLYPIINDISSNHPGVLGGASVAHHGSGIVARMLARKSEPVQAALHQVASAVRQATLGVPLEAVRVS